MSRSWKTLAAGSFIGDGRSEKADKKAWHRHFRTRTRQTMKALRRTWEPDTDWDAAVVHLHVRALSNPWAMTKDGKGWWFPGVWRKRHGYFARPFKFKTYWGNIKTTEIRELHKVLGK